MGFNDFLTAFGAIHIVGWIEFLLGVFIFFLQ